MWWVTSSIACTLRCHLSLIGSHLLIAGDEQLNEVAEAIQPVEAKSYTPQDQPHALLYEQKHQGVGGSGIAYGR